MVDDELQELLADFLLECDERLATVESSLLELTKPTANDKPALLESIRRDLHTLKGNSGMMGLTELQTLAHSLEDTVAELDPKDPAVDALLTGIDQFKSGLGELRSPSPAKTASVETPKVETSREASVRVNTSELDALLDLTTELLITRNRLTELTSSALALDDEAEDHPRESQAAWKAMEDLRLELSRIIAPLDDGLRRLRMVPLQRLFSRLQRIVHDEAARGRKKVRLITRGEETPLDAALVETAADTLGHLVRNAIVHGIEKPALRRMAGKPEKGTILLEASVRGRWVEIEVLDDGVGIDHDRLVKAAIERGVDADASTDLHALVFTPGLTTTYQADQSSGRGIGTSAVLAAVHRYGGTIDIDTAIGVGTRFFLRLPLTVAVTEALLLEAGGERYALPIGTILETTTADQSDLVANGEEQFLQREGIIIPLIDLTRFFQAKVAAQQQRYAVLLTAEGKLRALLVDRLGDVTTIVVNPLDPALGHPLGIAGTTVLGSGEVIMILDPPAFAASFPEVPS
jgi:two-component system chemotaxis sensor kinase CheA